MGKHRKDDRTYTITTYRHWKDGQWKDEYRAVPDDMSKEDIVTRFLYWLEEKLVRWVEDFQESTPLFRGMRSELDQIYADLDKHAQEMWELYPEDMKRAHEERMAKYDYLDVIHELD